MSIIRLKKMENYINEKEEVSTNDLAEHFNITVQTVRTDLASLEQKGLIKRYHGGAASMNKLKSFNFRVSQNQEEKQHIADYIVSTISNYETIFLDGGTTMVYIVERLPSNIKINIITASIAIADAATRLNEVEVYLLGGMLNKETKEVYGPTTISEVKDLSFDKAFIGVSGITAEIEFTENNLISMEMKKIILKNCKEKIVLADSSKFGIRAMHKAFSFEDIDEIVTSGNITNEAEYRLKKVNINNLNRT